MQKIEEKFEDFVIDNNFTNDNFRYWSIFLDNLFPILTDLTQSFRQGDWNKHLSAVRRAIPLFFAFGHTNYSRWTPIYYEECLNLEKKYPLLHTKFIVGDFVVAHSYRKGSSVPIDQALESAYNKPAKGPGGIIAKWNLIKHEKAGYTEFMNSVCDLAYNDEYTIHHELSNTFTNEEEKNVKTLFDFLSERGGVFKNGPLSNIISGEEYDPKSRDFFIDCMKIEEMISIMILDKNEL